MKEDLSLCIESCKGMQVLGIQAFKNRPNNAVKIWQGALALEVPDCTADQSQFYIDIKLPDSLLNNICTHGTIKSTIVPIVEPHLSIQNMTINISSQDFQNVIENEKNISAMDLTTDKLELNINSSSVSSSSLRETSSNSLIHSSSHLISPQLQAPVEKFREVDMVTTFAGSIKGFKDGNGKNAQFDIPNGICFNPNDECFYICDMRNNAIRKMTLQGDISTAAKCTEKVYDIAVYCKENTLFASCGHSIIKILPTEKVEVFAGDIKTRGYKDGAGTNAQFHNPSGITINQKTGNIFVCDSSNDLIRMVTQKAVVSTLAGSSTGYKDGNGKKAQFSFPYGICFNEVNQSLLVCDRYNSQIRQISLTGEVSTVCKVDSPCRITPTNNGRFMITSWASIFQMTLHETGNGDLKKFAGDGLRATVDGRANECSFNSPWGITVHDSSNSCFVTEHNGHVIRKITFK